MKTADLVRTEASTAIITLTAMIHALLITRISRQNASRHVALKRTCAFVLSASASIRPRGRYAAQLLYCCILH
jgi:hypothetical protein